MSAETVGEGRRCPSCGHQPLVSRRIRDEFEYGPDDVKGEGLFYLLVYSFILFYSWAAPSDSSKRDHRPGSRKAQRYAFQVRVRGIEELKAGD